MSVTSTRDQQTWTSAGKDFGYLPRGHTTMYGGVPTYVSSIFLYSLSFSFFVNMSWIWLVESL